MPETTNKNGTLVTIKKVVFTHPSRDWKDKDGNVHKSSFYKLELDSGYSIIFSPSKTSDYAVLNAIAITEFNATAKPESKI